MRTIQIEWGGGSHLYFQVQAGKQVRIEVRIHTNAAQNQERKQIRQEHHSRLSHRGHSGTGGRRKRVKYARMRSSRITHRLDT